MVCTWIPLIVYSLLLLLVIVLLTYLLRRHVVGHVLHTAWAYALYTILILTILSVVAEYFVCGQTLYPVIFGIAAIIAVFILDIILTMLVKYPAVYKGKPKATKTDIQELDELRDIVKSFKKRKKKK